MAATAAVTPPTAQSPTASKAPAIPSTTAGSATAIKPEARSRASTSQAVPRRSTRPTSTDYLSDRATIAFIRRTLCAQHLAERGRNSPAPIEELLPPLTSRNDVDLQLYAVISIILKEFVQKWYSNITPDESFVTEIVQIIAHCTRALEQRLRHVNLESLLLDELPEVLDAHVRGSYMACLSFPLLLSFSSSKAYSVLILYTKSLYCTSSRKLPMAQSRQLTG
jgi:hypothetical protein